MQTKYPQLKNFVINDSDTKPEILVHIILGVSDYTRIKTPETPRVDLIGELIAELMKFGWVFVSPEFNSKMTNILFSKTSQYDYENLGCLDCLGIEENHVKSDYYVHEKNWKKCHFSDEFYEANLIWKENLLQLNDSKSGRKERLSNLLRNLKRVKRLEIYDSII